MVRFRVCRSARAPFIQSALLLVATALVAVGCEPDLDLTRETPVRGTFGQIIYRESCQRVAWTSQLDEMRSPLDVSNSIYGPVCRDDATPPDDSPARLRELTHQKGVIVRVVDLVLPDNFLSSLEKFLEAIEVLSDDGTMEETIHAAAAMLDKLIADDSFTSAMGRVSGREGFRPTRYASGMTPGLFDFEGIDQLLDDTLDVLLDRDGNPTPELKQLLVTLAKEMGAAQPVDKPSDPNRTLALATNLLFRQSPDASPGALPLYVAKRDARGVAVPADDLVSSGVRTPFTDEDGDGLADADEHGRLVSADGKSAVAPPFAVPGVKETGAPSRDTDGRLLRVDGKPAYSYVDLNGTVLSALVQEQKTLADPAKDDLLGLVYGATGLLGPRTAKTKTYKDAAGKTIGTLSYQAFAVESAALLDLAHAFVQLLGAPRIADVLLATRTLLDKYENPTARLVAAMFDANDRGKNDAKAKIPATSTLYDDLVPLITRVLAVPGLANDMLTALQDPHSKGLAAMLSAQMAYSDRFILDQNHQDVVSGSFKTPVDRSQPDAGWNRSVLQRMLHLIHDANGAKFCNKQGAAVKVGPLSLLTFDRCKMFEIDDLALFFALTIVDHSITDGATSGIRQQTTRNVASFREAITSTVLKAVMPDDNVGDALIGTLTDIEGFGRFPTPQAAARSLFLETAHQSDFLKNSIDPVECIDGERFIDVHDDTIFAWEKPIANNPSGFTNDSFYDAVRPLMNTFARYDECVARDEKGNCTKWQNAVKIFLDLLATLHNHWGTVQSSYLDAAGNKVSYQSTDKTKPRYASGDGVSTYEKVISDVLGPQGDLVPSLIALAPTLQTMTLDGSAGTPKALPILLDVARFTFDPAVTPASLAYRDGRTSTTYSDGKTNVPRATLYYLIADAYAKKRLQLGTATPDRAGSWRAATSDLVDLALTVEHLGNSYYLKNRRMHGVTLTLVDFLRERIAAHQKAGDFDAWVKKDLVQDLSDSVGGPTFAAAADLLAKLEANPGALQDVNSLLVNLADDTAGGEYERTMTTAGDLLQALLDDPDLIPIAHGLGSVLDVDSLAPTLRMMKRARKLDPNKPGAGKHATLVTILANFFKPQTTDATPMSDLADSLASINRTQPGAATDLDGGDYRDILVQVDTFLSDEERGFLRFVQIVKNRKPAPAPASDSSGSN